MFSPLGGGAMTNMDGNPTRRVEKAAPPTEGGRQHHPQKEEGSTTERRSRQRSTTLEGARGIGTTAQEEQGGPPLDLVTLPPYWEVLLSTPSFCVVAPLGRHCLLLPHFRC